MGTPLILKKKAVGHRQNFQCQLGIFIAHHPFGLMLQEALKAVTATLDNNMAFKWNL
jgi:hypothetical protein